MEVNMVTWAITIAVVIGLFIFDFYSHVRTPHEPTLKESAIWSLVYVGLACVFGVFLWFTWAEPGNPHQHGLEFFNGYIVEKALSVDNLFVFALIMGSFQIPRKYQQKVLLIGIMLALAFRLVFILLGKVAIDAWSDVFYLFGLFLLYTAIKLVVDEIRNVPETDPNDMWLIKTLRRVIPVAHGYESDHLFIHKKGQFAVTTLFVALIAIGMIDVMFALDSIPAIYGITTEPYIVFTTNAFALLGLRQMYFLLDGLLDRLVFLPYGLGGVLAFISVKLILHALHENKLWFINGGESVPVPEIPTVWSLLTIVGILVIAVVASLIKTKRDEAQGAIAVKWNKDYEETPAGDTAAEPTHTTTAEPTRTTPAENSPTQSANNRPRK